LEQRVFALQDALWNTTALVDVNGDVLNRFAYTPYGVVETLNANWTHASSPSIPWAVLFRGYFADEGTGLLHARNRQYSPTLGRFVGRDPLGYVDGASMYLGYFIPNKLDPSGMEWEYRGTNRVEVLPDGSGDNGYTVSDSVVKGRCKKCCDDAYKPCKWKAELQKYVVWAEVFVASRNRFGVRTIEQQTQTLGHEFIHARGAEQVHDGFKREVNAAFPGACIYETQYECETDVAVKEIDLKRLIDAALTNNANHFGPSWVGRERGTELWWRW
jgi:RHS repeat-associated protein